MYQVSVPVMVTSPMFDAEAIYRDLKEAEIRRIFLAIDMLTTDAERQEKIFEKLSAAVDFFRSRGMEVGVWFWTFWLSGSHSFTPMTSEWSGEKKESRTMCCPMDPGYLDFMERNLTRIAGMHPDIILFDDDFRFGMQDMGYGCTCRLHRARISELLCGEELPEGNLLATVFGGKPNRYRSAFLRANGESLLHFAERVRKAVDRVDPSIRVGACACTSSFDADGTDAFTIAHTLAGSTRPLVRLIGAPYWATVPGMGCRLEDVIELERKERSWYAGTDIEIISEGDTWPRPRYRVPSAYLELFDTALRADGTLCGIHKYMEDYESTPSYERRYLTEHIGSRERYRELEEAFSGGRAVGFRVWEPMKKMETADYSEETVTENMLDHSFQSYAARVLSQNAIPTVWAGTGCAGIAFGEAARHLPPEAFEVPLVLDLSAAKILSSMGTDVGIDSFGERITPAGEFFFRRQEFLCVRESRAFACRLTLRSGAVPDSEWRDAAGEPLAVSCFSYRNAAGQAFVVLNLDGYAAPPGAAPSSTPEGVYRNYCRPQQLQDLVQRLGAVLPVRCDGNPDLYLLCKEKDGEMVVGLWNCFADALRDAEIRLTDLFRQAEFCGCDGTFADHLLTIRYLPAFSYAWIRLKR